MSENNNDLNENDKPHEQADDFSFLQEKIKERPINKKKLLRRTLITALLAVLFGVLACLSFLLLEPVLNNWLYPEEEPEVVTFPQESDEMLPEDMLTEGDMTETATETDESTEASNADTETQPQESSAADESLVGDEGDTLDGESGQDGEEPVDTGEDGDDEAEPESPLQNYMDQYSQLYAVYKEASYSMVTVTALYSDVDWFNNTYQSEGVTAGVIIANNNKELLILSHGSPLADAQSIQITFSNGTYSNAEIKQYDSGTDLVVLAVDLKNVTSATLDYVSVARLGSSTPSSLVGTPVVAIGNIFGYNDSVCYGIVTSNNNAVELVDSQYKLVTTDIYASENPSGVLVNLSGEVIGIIDNSYNNSDTQNLLSAIGISELKGMITKLSNGEDLPYLGIYVQDITSQARSELGLPQGAYIFDIDMDSPAMQSGIQKGDIIVKIGSQEIRSASDYTNAVRNVEIGKNLQIVVQRASVDAYEEMTFTVQPST